MHEVVQLETKLADGPQLIEIRNLINDALKQNDLSREKRRKSDGKKLEEFEAFENEIEILDLKELKLLNEAKVKGEAALKKQQEQYERKEENAEEIYVVEIEPLQKLKPLSIEPSKEETVQINPETLQKPTLEEFQELQGMETFPLFSEKSFFNSLTKKNTFYKKITLPILNLLASCAAKTEKGEGSRENILCGWLLQLEKIKAKAEIPGSLYPKQFGKKLMRILYAQLSSWEEIGVIKNARMILKFIQDNKISVKELLKQLVSLSWPKEFVVQFDKIPSDDNISLCLEKFVKEGKLDDDSHAIMSEVFPKEMASWPALFQIALLALVAFIQSEAEDPESNKILIKDLSENKEMLGSMPKIIDWLKQLADLIPSGGVQEGAQVIVQVATAAVDCVPYRKTEEELVEKLKYCQKAIAVYKALEKDHLNIIRYCDEQLALYELVYPKKDERGDTDTDIAKVHEWKIQSEEIFEDINQLEKKVQELTTELERVKVKASEELEKEEVTLIKMLCRDLLQGLLGRHNLKPYLLFLFSASNLGIARVRVACEKTDKNAMKDYQKQVCQVVAGGGALLAQFANEVLKNEEYNWLVNALEQILSQLTLPTNLMRTNLTDWATTNILSPFALEEPMLTTDEKERKVSAHFMSKPTLEKFKEIQGLDQAMSLPNLLSALGKKGLIQNMMHSSLNVAASFAVKDVSSYLFWKETVPREVFVEKWKKELDAVIKEATVEFKDNVGQETPYEEMNYRIFHRGLEFLADSGVTQGAEWLLGYIEKNKITASKILEEAKNVSLPKTFSIPFAHLPTMSELPNILLDFCKDGKLNQATEKLFKEHFPKEIAQWPYPLLQVSLLFMLSLYKTALDAIDTNEKFRSAILQMPMVSIPPILRTIAEWSGWLAGGILEGGIRLFAGWIESLPIPSAKWMIGQELERYDKELKRFTEQLVYMEKLIHAEDLFRQALDGKAVQGKKYIELCHELKNQDPDQDSHYVEKMKIAFAERQNNIYALVKIPANPNARMEVANEKEYLIMLKTKLEELEKQLEWVKTKSFKKLEGNSHSVVKMVGQDLVIGLLQRHKLQAYIPLLFIPFRIAPALRAYADKPKDANLRDALEKEISAGVTTGFTLFKRFATEIYDHKEYRWLLKTLDDILANVKLPKDLMRTNWLQWLQDNILARF